MYKTFILREFSNFFLSTQNTGRIKQSEDLKGQENLRDYHVIHLLRVSGLNTY